MRGHCKNIVNLSVGLKADNKCRKFYLVFQAVACVVGIVPGGVWVIVAAHGVLGWNESKSANSSMRVFLFEFELDGSAHQVDEDFQFVILLKSGIKCSGVLTFDCVAAESFKGSLRNLITLSHWASCA